MGPGGAERVMSHLLAHLSTQHTVTLLTFESEATASFYPLPPSVSYLKADKLGYGLDRVWHIVSRPGMIRRIVKTFSPDAIISFSDTTNITTLIACLGLRIPVIVSERVDPFEHDIGWAKDRLRLYTYPLARVVVVPSRRVAEYFPAHLQSRIRVIGNPIPLATGAARASMDNSIGRKRIIAVGRYDWQKGFDLLVDAFGLISQAHSDWDLVIFGEGPERPRLAAQVRRLRLETRVKLKGVVGDIFDEFAQSHVIACSSRYEGFPNALAEGLAHGLPAVGYRGVSGVEDLIIDGKTGLLADLAEGATGLARALSKLVGDPGFRGAASGAALEHVRRWTPDRIFSLWDEALADAINSTQH
jgi:glycosyltransferase involved in cell wall biosynthesis